MRESAKERDLEALSLAAARVAGRILADRPPSDEECFQLIGAVARAITERDATALQFGFDLLRTLREGLPAAPAWDVLRGRLWSLEVLLWAVSRTPRPAPRPMESRINNHIY